MIAVLQDTNYFFNMLAQRYGISMYQNGANRTSISYIGECFSVRGESFIVNIIVGNQKTDVFVYNVTGHQKSCVFQKSYSTVSDKNALSKSTSLFNKLDRLLF